jgi:hypothetical protein
VGWGGEGRAESEGMSGAARTDGFLMEIQKGMGMRKFRHFLKS